MFVDVKRSIGFLQEMESLYMFTEDKRDSEMVAE